VLVTNGNSGSVTPISVSSDAAGAPIAVDGAPSAIAATATTAYVAVGPSGVAPGNDVTPITIATGAKGKPVPVAKGPSAIALTPDGATAWVVCYATGTLESIDLASGKVGTVLAVGGGPYALTITTKAQAPTPAHKARHKR
jgi:DNA-binding beta-propeller fold protein YncE